MQHNLLIAYELHNPAQNLKRVHNAILKLCASCDWFLLQQSLWFIKSPWSAYGACEAIWDVMDANDTLMVVDATFNQAAFKGYDGYKTAAMITLWKRRSLLQWISGRL